MDYKRVADALELGLDFALQALSEHKYTYGNHAAVKGERELLEAQVDEIRSVLRLVRPSQSKLG